MLTFRYVTNSNSALPARKHPRSTHSLRQSVLPALLMIYTPWGRKWGLPHHNALAPNALSSIHSLKTTRQAHNEAEFPVVTISYKQPSCLLRTVHHPLAPHQGHKASKARTMTKYAWYLISALLCPFNMQHTEPRGKALYPTSLLFNESTTLQKPTCICLSLKFLTWKKETLLATSQGFFLGLA